MKKKHIAALAVCAALAACGGGGSDGSGSAGGGGTTPTAEGAYSGTLTGSQVATAVTMLVTETGRAYAIYGNKVNDVLYVTGAAIGTGESSGSSFTSNSVKDYYYPGAPLTATLNSTFVQGSSVTGSLRYANGVTATFSATSAGVLPYVYAQAANLSEAVGTWPVAGLYGQTGTVTVGTNGSFTSNISGCVSTGTLTAAPGARNYFNLTATAGQSPCATPGAAYSGAVVVSPIVGRTTKQMIAAATTADGTVAVVAFGEK